MSGEGSTEERFLQTLHTIDSIRSRINNSEIWLCDSSSKKLEPYMIDMLEMVNFLDFSNNQRVLDIRNEVEKFHIPSTDEHKPFYRLGLLKNLTEIHIINQVLKKIEVGNYERIFKISGRYFLTKPFDLNSHNIFGKITLLPVKESLLGEKYVGSNYYRHCMTWNFCTSIYSEIKESFDKIENYLIKQTQFGLLGDIEHGLHLHIPTNLIHEISKYGVVGRVNNEAVDYR
jgi:hypothetical protein